MEKAQQKNKLPLDGLRVLDLATFVASPFSAAAPSPGYLIHCSSIRGSISFAILRSAAAPALSPSSFRHSWRDQ